MSSLLSIFSRLSVRSTGISLLVDNSRAISTTPILLAEPLKKKKKLDPAIIRQRDERKRKKLEKQIRRLEKNSRQLKPIDELEVPLELLDEKSARNRVLPKLSEEVKEQRILLQKKWAHYKLQERVTDFQIIDRIMQSQKKALEELRKESEDLYQEAIQPDINLTPISFRGPVNTPPIKGYVSPDGDYIDISKKWE